MYLLFVLVHVHVINYLSLSLTHIGMGSPVSTDETDTSTLASQSEYILYMYFML